ncbi:MAG: aldolase/citrate lyase family protein [Hyphomicrobiaceae bacterium]|nr:aldolase/citrate lyase family protein [Hyphomicrobiaceae bacterium]
MTAGTIQSFRARLRAGSTLLGGFVFSTDPNITEIYAAADFDFVILDLEHTMGDLQIVAAHLRAARASGIHAVVRIGRSQIHDVPRLLDGGCKGLMLPHLGLPHYGANEALRTMRYAPDGERPACTGVPAASYGLSPFTDYVRHSNEEVAAIGLVEDKACVEDIETVLDAGGIDCVMPGPGDLSVSYGVHGQFAHPLVQNAVATVLAAARQRSIPAGLYISDPSEVAAGLARGFSVFVLSIDYKLLGNTLRAATARMREELR